MNSSMPRLIVILSFLLAPVLAAQAPGRGDLSVRLLAERVPGGIGQVVLVAQDKTTEPFDLPVNHLSDPVVAPARTFGVRPADAEAKLATVTLPEVGRSFIVLLVPAAEGGYKPVVVPAEDASFKAGDVYFYNHADKTVIGYVGTSTFTLPPGRGQIVRPAGPREDTFYDVAFGVRDATGDRPFSTTRWPIETRVRAYVFFFTNPTTNRVDYRAVDEYLSPPEAATP